MSASTASRHLARNATRLASTVAKSPAGTAALRHKSTHSAPIEQTPAPVKMALSHYNPDRFLAAMDRFFEDLEPRWARSLMPRMGGKTATWSPTCDVRETDKNFIIQAEVPGAKKEDIKLELDGNQLRISGEVKDERVEKNDTYYHSERTYGQFTRTFAMPETADLDNIRAEHLNGVLHVTVPKKAVVQPNKRTITVN